MDEGKGRISLEDRRALALTGVKDVSAFSEDGAVVDTVLGVLEVSGRGLHVDLLDLDRGEARLSGDVDGIWYRDEGGAAKKGFFARLFSK